MGKAFLEPNGAPDHRECRMDASNMDRYAIVVADRAGTIQFWNRGATELLGHASEDMLGRKLDAMVPEVHREQHWVGFNRAMEAGSVDAEGSSFELPARHRDGSVILHPATFVLLRDGQRQVIGAMAILSAPRN